MVKIVKMAEMVVIVLLFMLKHGSSENGLMEIVFLCHFLLDDKNGKK
jgi:hypothetical protein